MPCRCCLISSITNENTSQKGHPRACVYYLLALEAAKFSPIPEKIGLAMMEFTELSLHNEIRKFGAGNCFNDSTIQLS
jgi:hypothetical protein